jgi:GTPase SAR1 family protein
MNKVKMLQWIVVLLLLLNLSTIAGIVYHNYQEKNNDELLISDSQNESRLNGRYFRQTLGFDNEQMEAFRAANRLFQPKANAIIISIDSLKNDIFEELKKSNPDTEKLNRLSEGIGLKHTALKKETNQFYLNIKQVCNPSQKELLNEVFSPLFKNKYTAGPGFNRDRKGKIPCEQSNNE